MDVCVFTKRILNDTPAHLKAFNGKLYLKKKINLYLCVFLSLCDVSPNIILDTFCCIFKIFF